MISVVSTVPASQYMQLVEAFPLRPIRNDHQLDAAIVVMRSLLGIELTEDQGDYLDVLGDLIRAYESDHHPLPTLSDAEILRHFLDHRGVTQTELSVGADVPESTISAILAGRRGISKANMITFGKFFEVPPGRFLAS